MIVSSFQYIDSNIDKITGIRFTRNDLKMHSFLFREIAINNSNEAKKNQPINISQFESFLNLITFLIFNVSEKLFK